MKSLKKNFKFEQMRMTNKDVRSDLGERTVDNVCNIFIILFSN